MINCILYGTLHEDQAQEQRSAYGPSTHQITNTYLANRKKQHDYLQPKRRYGGWGNGRSDRDNTCNQTLSQVKGRAMGGEGENR